METKRKINNETAVRVAAGSVSLEGNLRVPEDACGIVLFAHGSGSSRLSPRNQYVASVLYDAGLATLLFDLLTEEEEMEDVITGRLRFDVNFLANRLVSATDWVSAHPEVGKLDLGYFGASTGAAAALIAATQRPDVVRAIVSRGGRPDLAEEVLPRVLAPTLLIVGGRDYAVIPLNRTALEKLQVEKQLAIVSRATHLFEEPGALEEVARLASGWFRQHLGVRAAPNSLPAC